MSILAINFTFISILMVSAWTLKWASGHPRFEENEWIHGDNSSGHELGEAFVWSALVLSMIATIVVGLAPHV